MGSEMCIRDRPDRIVSVGDGMWDLLTAKNLDVEFIGIGSDAKEKALTEAGARVVVDYVPYALPPDFFDLARKLL